MTAPRTKTMSRKKAAGKATANKATVARKKSSSRKKSAARTSARTTPGVATAAARLTEFLDRYPPEIAAFGRRQMERLRRRMPTAHRMVYDNYNGLVIGFGPTERPSEAILSVLLLPDHVTLCFLQGAFLGDPAGVLRGSGNQVRHIRLEDDTTMDRPEVRALVERAIADCEPPFAASGRGPLVIQSVSAKQRPRRP